MTSRTPTLTFTLACVLCATACASQQPSFGTVNLATMPQPPLIKVTGEATVKVVPDQVIVKIGVDTRENTARSAKQRNDTVIRGIQEATRLQGVASKDFQSDYITLEPHYDPTRPQVLVSADERSMTETTAHELQL